MMTVGEAISQVRRMAWVRVKGDLNYLLGFDSLPGNVLDSKCAKRKEIIERFIQEVEDDELY